MKTKLIFAFEAVPNPDFRDGHRATVRLPLRMVAACDLKDASAKYRGLIVQHDLGGGNITTKAGCVYDEAGQQVARISYNGRAWDNDGRELKLED
jgi:hypothetical protein